MQLPEFNHNEKQWDMFKEFHNNITPYPSYNSYKPPFVLFESGEFIITSNYFNPHKRKPFTELGLTLFMTRDIPWRTWLKPLEFKTPDGDEIKRSWLEVGGSQTLVHDHDTKQVVSLGWVDSHKTNDHIPLRFRSIAYVYCAGKGEPLIGRGPVKIRQPDPLSKDERKHVQTIKNACKVWYELSGAKEKRWGHAAQLYNAMSGKFEPQENHVVYGKLEVEKLLALEFNDMPDNIRVQLAKYGLKSRVKTTEVPYLIKSERF